jgi:hypothetical protein
MDFIEYDGGWGDDDVSGIGTETASDMDTLTSGVRCTISCPPYLDPSANPTRTASAHLLNPTSL